MDRKDTMIIITRRTGESFRLCPDWLLSSVKETPVDPVFSGVVKVTVVAVKGARVTLEVSGPEDLSVRPEEDSGPAG